VSDDLVASIIALRPSASVSVAADGRSAVISGVDADPQLIAAIARWAAEHGLLITEWHAGAASLEERYLALTGDSAVERTS
jgi:hypothetical protein